MGLLDDFEYEAYQVPCKVRTIAATLDPADAEVFLRAVENPDWPAKRLEQQLKGRGIKISDTPIMAHRRKECSCNVA